MTPGRMCVPTLVHQIKMFDNNLRIWESKQNWSFPLLIFFCQICTVCNQGLGQFHIHVNFVIGRDILSTDVVMQTRILIMIEMLTHNPDVAKHRLVQSMPLSMVDPGSTKPNINKHFPRIFGRLWTSTCTWLQSNPGLLRSFMCLQRIQ